MLRDAYQQYEKLIPSPAWHTYIQDVMDVRSRLGEAELIVAELGGRLVGAVTLYLDALRSPREGWPKGWAAIRLLAVHPKYRRQGIGRALVEECIRRCRGGGVITIGLHTTEAMDAAVRIYERLGFVRLPEFDFHPASGVVVMAYRLDLGT